MSILSSLQYCTLRVSGTVMKGLKYLVYSLQQVLLISLVSPSNSTYPACLPEFSLPPRVQLAGGVLNCNEGSKILSIFITTSAIN
jgi:hypothetical protein